MPKKQFRRSSLQEWQRVAIAIVLTAGLALTASPARATNIITVTWVAQNDVFYCTLPAAIINHNNGDQSGSVKCVKGSGDGEDIIELAPVFHKSINLDAVLPDIERGTIDLQIPERGGAVAPMNIRGPSPDHDAGAKS
jgi:hypothetical protein